LHWGAAAVAAVVAAGAMSSGVPTHVEVIGRGMPQRVSSASSLVAGPPRASSAGSMLSTASSDTSADLFEFKSLGGLGVQAPVRPRSVFHRRVSQLYGVAAFACFAAMFSLARFQEYEWAEKTPSALRDRGKETGTYVVVATIGAVAAFAIVSLVTWQTPRTSVVGKCAITALPSGVLLATGMNGMLVLLAKGAPISLVVAGAAASHIWPLALNIIVFGEEVRLARVVSLLLAIVASVLIPFSDQFFDFDPLDSASIG
jgi:hypothetical protein